MMEFLTGKSTNPPDNIPKHTSKHGRNQIEKIELTCNTYEEFICKNRQAPSLG